MCLCYYIVCAAFVAVCYIFDTSYIDFKFYVYKWDNNHHTNKYVLIYILDLAE